MGRWKRKHHKKKAEGVKDKVKQRPVSQGWTLTLADEKINLLHKAVWCLVLKGQLSPNKKIHILLTCSANY